MTDQNLKLWTEVVNKLIKKKLTISTMESCTGGAIASIITDIPGASDILKEAYVTYSNEAKIKLGVKRSIIDKYSVYSAETSVSMAEALKKKTDAKITVGITGMLGRIDPANPCDALNSVWYSICFGEDEIFTQYVKVSDFERYKQKEELLTYIGNSLNSILDLRKRGTK